MGMYDLPAMINKALETTRQEKLFYLGHSMGTTAFMVMTNMRPEMNEKIELASLLAPEAYLGHARSPLKYLAPFVDEIDVSIFDYDRLCKKLKSHLYSLLFITLKWILQDLFGMGEFLPSSRLMDFLAAAVCDEDSLPKLCANVLFLICGFNSGQMNLTIHDTIIHHTPAGTSSKSLVHYAQEMQSGTIHQ